MNGNDLYNRFVKMLSDRNMSKSEFCKKTGIKQTALSNWSARGTMPSADLALAIAKCLNVSVDYVLGNSDVPNPSAINNFTDNELDMVNSFRNLDEESQRQLVLMLAFLKEQGKK